MASLTAWAKKVWKDRKTEYPTRRTLTKTDGSQEIVTVARNEGNVSQEGDAFSAANMNDLEERIDAGFTEVNSKLNNESFSLQSGTSAITPAGTIASYDKASKKVFIAFSVLGSRKADEVIYVVPEKYRPSAHVQGVCILKTSAGEVTMGACSIKTNGYCVHNVTNADTNCVMCIFNYGI